MPAQMMVCADGHDEVQWNATELGDRCWLPGCRKQGIPWYGAWVYSTPTPVR